MAIGPGEPGRHGPDDRIHAALLFWERIFSRENCLHHEWTKYRILICQEPKEISSASLTGTGQRDQGEGGKGPVIAGDRPVRRAFSSRRKGGHMRRSILWCLAMAAWCPWFHDDSQAAGYFVRPDGGTANRSLPAWNLPTIQAAWNRTATLRLRANAIRIPTGPGRRGE